MKQKQSKTKKNITKPKVEVNKNIDSNNEDVETATSTNNEDTQSTMPPRTSSNESPADESSSTLSDNKDASHSDEPTDINNSKDDLSVLRVDDLHKFFRKKHAVKGVSFSMKQGEVVGLLGPNGAGKTTSFYMIVGFYKPNTGNIYLNDLCLTRLPMYKRARAGISYLPQEASVFRKLTVEQNIYSILQMRRDLKTSQKKERLEFLLNEFGITKNRFQQAYTLSGGERRRTEIARALAIEPKFLLLDEPFAGIDPIAVHDIKSIIRLLAKQGIGILITDHNVRDTLEITDRAYIIGQGEIVEEGSKEKILNSEIARKIYLGEEFRM